MAKKPKQQKSGRPSIYSEELTVEICRRLAEGESLRKICDDNEMPDKSTVLGWLFDGEHDEFSDQYARARNAQAELWADEIMEIADAPAADPTAVQHSRLRVDARKWVAAKLLPKKYGDNVQVGASGGTGSLHLHVDLSGKD